MDLFFLCTLFGLICLIPIYLFRAVYGPSVFDRLIGLNGIATKSILILAAIGVVFDQLGMFLDLCLGFVLLTLVGNVAVGKFLEKRDVTR